MYARSIGPAASINFTGGGGIQRGRNICNTLGGVRPLRGWGNKRTDKHRTRLNGRGLKTRQIRVNYTNLAPAEATTQSGARQVDFGSGSAVSDARSPFCNKLTISLIT